VKKPLYSLLAIFLLHASKNDDKDERFFLEDEMMGTPRVESWAFCITTFFFLATI
jgi:hypothetical protein